MITPLALNQKYTDKETAIWASKYLALDIGRNGLKIHCSAFVLSSALGSLLG